MFVSEFASATFGGGVSFPGPSDFPHPRYQADQSIFLGLRIPIPLDGTGKYRRPPAG